MKKTYPTILLSIVAVAAATQISANYAFGESPITWSPSSGVNITGDNDVATNGSLVMAFNLGNTGVSAATVNGVAFAPFEVPFDGLDGTTTVGNASLTLFSRSSSNTAFGSATAPYSNLSPDYQTLLSAGVFNNSSQPMTLTLSGLTNGQTYLFQFWVNDADNTFTNGGATTTATATNSVVVLDNAAGVAAVRGTPGQYAIGTFTADATGTETITFSPSFIRPELNAFQLRAVPEPSSLALLGFGATALLRASRRRKS